DPASAGGLRHEYAGVDAQPVRHGELVAAVRAGDARPLRPEPAADRSVRQVDREHRAARRFRLLVHVLRTGGEYDFGAHGTDFDRVDLGVYFYMDGGAADRDTVG